jgi:hypothetical protein
MSRCVPVPALVLALAFCAVGAVAWAGDPRATPPAPERWVVGDTVFEEVRVLSTSPSAVTIRHRGGLAQVPFSDLPEALRRRFAFDPMQAAAHDAAVQAENERRAAEAAIVAQQRRNEVAERSGVARTATERALQRFGRPAPVVNVDLREEFRALDLVAKNQGRRPSCSVFAVVSALEIQRAKLTGTVEKLSEEYLVWATRRQLGLTVGDTSRVHEGDDVGDRDAGYALGEVLAALRAYGIPLQAAMPNTYGLAQAEISSPPDHVIAEAQNRRDVFLHRVTGRTTEAQIDNLLHALAEGVPVVVGMRWPHSRTLRQPLLSEQAPVPGYAHAVTIVGCYSETGRKEDLRFIFRNSWGIRWGVGGHGFVTYDYLRRHLLEAVVLEVRH